MAFNYYDEYRKELLTNSSRTVLGVFKCALVTADYVVEQNTHKFYSDITDEVVGAGYVAGGNSCGNPVTSLSATGLIVLNANDPRLWQQSVGGFTNASRAILYFDNGNDETSKLMLYSDPFPTNGNSLNNFKITFSTSGISQSIR